MGNFIQTKILNTEKSPSNDIINILKSTKPIYKNAGTIEDIHKECEDIIKLPQKGANIICNKHLSNHFYVTHILKILPNDNETCCYKFGITYVGPQAEQNDNHFYPVWHDPTNNVGSVLTGLYHNINSKVRIKCGAEYNGNKLSGSLLCIDYLGKTYSATLNVKNMDFLHKCGTVDGAYLKAANANLSIGSEFGCQYCPIYPRGREFIYNIITKYTNNSNTIGLTLGSKGLNLTYMKKTGENFKLGAAFKSAFLRDTTVATIGYQIELPTTEFLFRGYIDTNWNICSVLEKRLLPLPVLFSLEAKFNQRSGKFQIGCGAILS